MASRAQLRLALFSGNYNTVRDGANRALNRLTDYMLKRNVVVKVFSPTVPNPAFAPVGELHSLPSIPFPGRGDYRLAYRFGRANEDQLGRFQPHIVHLSAPDIMGHRAKNFAKQRAIPHVSSFHTHFETYLRYYKLSPIEPLARKIYRNFYNDCAHVYAPSPTVDSALEGYGVRAPIRRWSRGINCDDFTPDKRSPAWRKDHGLDPELPIVLFVGRLVKEKGLALLEETTQRLNSSGHRFQTVVVGDGPQSDELRRSLPNAYFTGHLDRGALTSAYANADIFFNPSDTETFGNVTLEAMASGLACVCSRAGGSLCLVDHGQNGFLANPRDAENHAHYTALLLGDDTLRQKFGALSRSRAMTRSWDAVMAELFGHYQDVLDQAYPAMRFDYQ